MLNLGPSYRRIRCPKCHKGTIRLTAGTARLQCDRLYWSHSGFSGGSCDFATYDPESIPLEPGEVLRFEDFTPLAYQTNPRPAGPA